MGLKEYAEKHKFDASFGGCRISGDTLQKGLDSWPVAGAKAEFEHGANVGSSVTATRVVLTGVFALALKKNKNKVYVMIELADGEQVLIEGKAKNEKDARKFAAKVNQAGAHFAEAS
jgi:hypothetical protein